MPYVLGVDVGRTRGAAAVCRRVGTEFGLPEVVRIDHGNRWSPAVLAIEDDGSVIIGAAAERHALIDPARVARDFVVRVGDGVPMLLGGELYPAETLAAAFIAGIVDTVVQAEGAQPDRVAVTHPPDWGTYRRGLLRDALQAAGVPGVLLLPTVVAAAEAAHERSPVPTGSAIALTLIGGRHCEHAVLVRGPVAFDVHTHVPMVDTDAGDHLDDLLAGHVLNTEQAAAPEGAAMASFRMACTTAKERLSVAPEVRVPLPSSPGDMTVTRAFFDELARAPLAAVVDDLAWVIDGVPDLVGAVLAGGTARVPLLAALAGVRLDCPVTVEDDPAAAACRGAALAARPRLVPVRLPVTETPQPGERSLVGLNGGPPQVKESAGVRLTALRESPPPRPPVEVVPLELPAPRFALPRRSRRREDER